MSQSSSRKFLDALEDTLASPKTSPVVRERLLDVLAAATFYSTRTSEWSAVSLSVTAALILLPGKDSRNEGFRGLWRKVKPLDKPDEVSFDISGRRNYISHNSRASHSMMLMQ